jgi:murein L,D-transpeptidase YcbB/YkuD
VSVLSRTTSAGAASPATPLHRRSWRAAASTIAAVAITVAGIAVAPAALATTAAGTTTTVTASPAGRVSAGTTVTLHIRVAATVTTTPSDALTGSVTVQGNDLPAAGVTATLVEGAATVPVKTAAAGLHTYLVTYAPTTAAYAPSHGNANVTVVARATGTKLTTSPATRINVGSSVTLRAVVSANAAGTVKFTDRGKTLKDVVVSRQVATLMVTPTLGNHAYRAIFTPTNLLAYSASASATIAVAATVPPATIPLVQGAKGALVVLAQRRLSWSGIMVRVTGTFDAATVTAVKRLQGKFFYPQSGIIDARTMALLAKLSVKTLPKACTNVGVALCIDKTRKILQFVVQGKVKYSVDARFGNVAEGLATRDGLFSIQRKTGRHHLSTEFKTDMPWAMFFSGGQAVHYSSYFAAVGYNGHSHGCVNIRDYNTIYAIYHQSPLGTPVFIYSS